MIVLVGQAAAQSIAHTGDRRGMEGYALLLSHLDGDGRKLWKEVRTTSRPSAGTASPHQLRLITRANLQEFDSGI